MYSTTYAGVCSHGNPADRWIVGGDAGNEPRTPEESTVMVMAAPTSQPTRQDPSMVLMRRLLGDVLRRRRTSQGRTLREVAASARVSLGYLSEVERGRKEASSELLAAICSALGVPMSVVMREVSDELARAEAAAVRALGSAAVARHPGRADRGMNLAHA
jgi:transcriptional regulator with XRE-family HTH domain